MNATVVYPQSTEVVTVPEVSYSYQIKNDAGEIEKRIFDLVELSNALSELSFAFRSPNEINQAAIDELQAEIDRLGVENSIAQPLVAGWEQGGMSAAAAIVILSVTSIGAEECAKLGKVLHGVPLLGSSSMRAVQNPRTADTTDGLGRGNFDIRTTKFVLCRDVSNNEIEGVPIIVRWVFNVNGDSLETETGNLTGPNGNAYKQNFHAEGLGIQLVLMEINGVALAQNNPVYNIVENACIDIWFVEEVSGFDISVPASITGYGVFCAGGYCKNNPPGLDATQ